MKKEFVQVFKEIHKCYQQKHLFKIIVGFLSCLVVFLSLYFLILPAITLNDDAISYTLTLKDSYDYEWKNDLEKEYSLKLYFMDNFGNYIEGKNVTLELGESLLADDPYSFGYVPMSGDSTRGEDLLTVWNLSEYSLSTGEKYVFDHAEVLIDGVWQVFTETSKHWNIWCQNASSTETKSDYGWRGQYGDNIGYIVTSSVEYKLVYQQVRYGKEHLVNSLGSNSGISFGIFNYQGGNDETGINANGLYNYFTFRDNSLDTTPYINGETDADGFGEKRAKVLPNLQNGYPVFNCKGYCNNASLGYLFGESINPNGSTPSGVTEYKPNNTLLQTEIVDGVEYYYYDSNRNAVDYDTFNNQFLLRDYVERGLTMSSYPKEINRYEFLPFDYWSDNRDEATVANTNFTYNYEKEEIDHWFGMTMEFQFYMPKNGMINGSDMIFSFSGDDDVWVFVDDVLVLDLGGTHGAVDGNINFKTGKVDGYLNWNDQEGTKNETTIYDSFNLANALDKVSWNETNQTFEDYTLHTVKFFYLERGAAISNCKIRFNIPVLPSGSLSVQKVFHGNTNYDDEYEFTLFDVTNQTPIGVNKATYYIGNNEYQTDSNGKFTLKQGEVATFELTNYHQYYVKETNSGNHSKSYQCKLDEVLCDKNNETPIFKINPESFYRVVFTNQIKTYDLKINKIVYGMSEDETFDFSLKLEDSLKNIILTKDNIVATNSYEIDGVNNEIRFSLKNEEEFIVKNIPLDTKIELEEIYHDGYQVIIKSQDVVLANDSNYEFVIDSDKEITIHNIPGVMLPETGGSGLYPYIIVGCLLILISAKYGYLYIFRRRESE